MGEGGKGADAEGGMLPLHMATNVAGERESVPLEREGGPSRDAPSVIRHADHFYEDTWIPRHRDDGTLPPHFGERMVLKHPCSPYPVTPGAFAKLFGTTEPRRALIRGLFELRRELRGIGITRGFQWIGGSLVERTEKVPSDVDVVTFFVLPDAWNDARERERVVGARPDLFDKAETKRRYRCDTYLVQLALKRDMFRHLVLWASLFGHDRTTNAWKGFCEVDLDAPNDDADAWAALS